MGGKLQSLNPYAVEMRVHPWHTAVSTVELDASRGSLVDRALMWLLRRRQPRIPSEEPNVRLLERGKAASSDELLSILFKLAGDAVIKSIVILVRAI